MERLFKAKARKKLSIYNVIFKVKRKVRRSVYTLFNIKGTRLTFSKH